MEKNIVKRGIDMKKKSIIIGCGIILVILVISIICFLSVNKNSDGENISDNKNKIKVTEENIGDYIEYDCFTGVDDNLLHYIVTSDKSGYKQEQQYSVIESYKDLKWKILGINDNGQVLITTDPVNNIRFEGKEGYLNGANELNNLCKIFGYGKGAESARSINRDDINKITKYNPEEKDEEYLKKYTYSLQDDGYIYANNEKGKYQKFEYYDEEIKSWIKLEKNQSKTEVNTDYSYNMRGKAPRFIMYREGTTGTLKSQEINYWLSTPVKSAGEWSVGYGLSTVRGDDIAFNLMYLASLGKDFDNIGFRPVVTLSSDVELEKDSQGVWKIK